MDAPPADVAEPGAGRRPRRSSADGIRTRRFGLPGRIRSLSSPSDEDRGAAESLASWRRRTLIVGAATVVVMVDQLTKTWALHHTVDPIHVIGTLRLALTLNPGAAFGIGRGVTPVLVLGAIVLVVLLLGLGRTASRTASRPAAVAMGLLLGGACGNLVDRLVRHNSGAVIDFIDFRWWPVFNVADACITVGALLLVLVSSAHHGTGPAAGGPAAGGAAAGGAEAGGAAESSAPAEE